MGLFIDNNGIPVSRKLFPGNAQDKTTFKNVLENDVDEMDLGRIVVVADNGMNTQENKYLITDKGNGYIVSKSVKKSWTKLGDWALDSNDYIEIKNASGIVVFKYKSRINEIELVYKNSDGTKSKKVVIFLEEKLKKYKETLGFYSIVTSEIEEILKSNNKEFKFKEYTINEIKELRQLINHMTI